MTLSVVVPLNFGELVILVATKSPRKENTSDRILIL